jgi:hypothetical protein
LELDENYSEAFHVLVLISQRAGEKALAEEYFAKAGGGAVGKPKAARGRRNNSSTAIIAPLFRVSPANSRRLITGGDRRLAEALRQDALNACSAVSNDGR